MNYKLLILYALFAFYNFSCGENKRRLELADEFERDYNALLLIHKTMEQEYVTYENKKDSLVTSLRDSLGVLSPEVLAFETNYEVLLEEYQEIIHKHDETLGAIAQLQDEVINQADSEDKLMEEKKSLVAKEKKVYNSYQILISRIEKFLRENNTTQTVRTDSLKG